MENNASIFDDGDNQENPPPQEHSVLVSNVPKGTTRDDLCKAFSTKGAVYATELFENRHYGFVRFYNASDVKNVLTSEPPSINDSQGMLTECVLMLLVVCQFAPPWGDQ